MANAYADLATLKSPSLLNVSVDDHDGRLLGLLGSASRWIDGYCDRHFAPRHGRLIFDGSSDGSGGDSLAVPDLIEVSSISVGLGSGRRSEWSADDWTLYPLNAEPDEPWGRPYTRIKVAAGSTRRFVGGHEAVIVDGVWGYNRRLVNSGWLVADMAPVGSGETSIAVAARSGVTPLAVSAGHTIRIGDEQLYVTSADRTGGVATATLVVERGVNGTSAAAHASARAASLFRYPDAVAEACLLLASSWWRQRDAAPFSAAVEHQTSESAGVDRAVQRLLEPFLRRTAALGV
jgi:hypothetical protein